MNALLETDISKEVAENILVFLDVNVSFVTTDLQTVFLLTAQLLVNLAHIPGKAGDNDSYDFAGICYSSNRVIGQLSLVLLLTLVR